MTRVIGDYIHRMLIEAVAAVQKCWCDVTISKWRQQQETRAKRVLYKRVLQTKQIMRPKIEYRVRRN